MRSPDQCHHNSRRSSLPRTKVSPRRSSGGSTEQYPEAGGGPQGVERFHKTELEKARQTAKAPPLKVQITSTKISSEVPRDAWRN